MACFFLILLMTYGSMGKNILLHFQNIVTSLYTVLDLRNTLLIKETGNSLTQNRRISEWRNYTLLLPQRINHHSHTENRAGTFSSYWYWKANLSAIIPLSKFNAELKYGGQTLLSCLTKVPVHLRQKWILLRNLHWNNDKGCSNISLLQIYSFK